MLAAIDKTTNSSAVDWAALYRKLKEEFVNPGVGYRGKPFWAWNGKLEKDELLFQIEVIHQMGMGGFFMHSRTGLETPYLSDEWFDLVRACCDKAKSLGMQAWLYDEDRWPSGFAGGIVTENEDFKQKRLRLQCVKSDMFEWNDDILAAFITTLDGNSAFDVQRLRSDKNLPSGRDVLVFTTAVSPASESFNGGSYVDTLSEEAMRRFIEVTHDAYRHRIGEYFGSVVPGIFTDEPNHGPTCVYTDIESDVIESPWTDAFPAIFMERYGYDIVDNLPAVFFDVDGHQVSKSRADFHDCRTHLFVNAFAKQIWQWCRQNDMLFTGHVLNESPLVEQVSFVGSAMRFYEYMDIPGVDILTDRHLPTGGRPEFDTIKQCVSVQRQMGRKQVLSELYGCTGWDFSLEGHKACGDWQAALGVNLRCHHHLWYSMQGQSKRDYPASISYQSPWWEQYGNVEDYFSRINVLTTQGVSLSKLLVIHPNESIWQMIRPGWCTKDSPQALMHEWSRTAEINELENKYLYIRDTLVKSNIDFDYGDEEMISRLAEVDSCEVKFNLGCCGYDAVLVPPLKTIRSSTLKMLDDFIDCGGKVIVVEQMPAYVDAVASMSAISLQTDCVVASLDKREILDCLNDLKVVDVLDEDGKIVEDILCRCSEDEGGRYIFVCNTNKYKSYDNLQLKIYDTGRFECVQRWNLLDGENFDCPALWTDEHTVIDISLPAAGSDSFVFFRDGINTVSLQPRTDVTDVRAIGGPFGYELSERNVLVLDRAKYSTNGKSYPMLDILEIDNRLRGLMGLKPRSGKMSQPWTTKSDDVDCRVELVFEFDSECRDCGELFIALEKPESVLSLKFNGSSVSVSQKKEEWWIDKSLRLLRVPSQTLKQGVNEISVVIDYNFCMGLEAMYLLGSFGVRVDGTDITMTTLSDQLTAGDWTKQGLTFYSGSVTYKLTADINRKDDETVYLHLPEFRGSCVAVNMNGKPVGTIWCRPYEIDISRFVVSGQNSIDIQVISHRRNTLGPLHLKAGGPRPGWTGPAEFCPDENYRQDEYNLVSCGLIKEPLIVCKTRSK